ncbi:hypothetical protein DY000_02062168 [Brassica cretica]|uniref:Uncharacterized protein n=1 Tax=Brassica cretica TaxID=69181 RepID=A0ABQ7B4A9_BRACR|nr:hypothetical protein DY000_02062168 [Brassica cretica]
MLPSASESVSASEPGTTSSGTLPCNIGFDHITIRPCSATSTVHDDSQLLQSFSLSLMSPIPIMIPVTISTPITVPIPAIVTIMLIIPTIAIPFLDHDPGLMLFYKSWLSLVIRDMFLIDHLTFLFKKDTRRL